MSDRLRVYIAGPISHGDLAANIRQADAAFIRLLRAGFAPLCPHWSCYCGAMAARPLETLGQAAKRMPEGTALEDWLGVDLPWVAVADAVLRLPGDSVGADREVALARELGIQVYDDIEELIAHPPAKGDARYHVLLKQMAALHDRKAADYGRGTDPFANVRASAEFGIASWVGVMIRANDKMHRIKSFLQNGQLKNESVEDSLQDLAAYCLIALILYREEVAKVQQVAA